jgi:hypothetical protein
MNILMRAAIPAVLAVLAPYALVQTTPASENACPMHESHNNGDTHHATVESHGDQAMGFPHDKTTHHFRLSDYGGEIEVTANDPNDTVNVEAIRVHLEHIAQVFSQGDFSTPMFVHDSIPPGVTTMKLLKGNIHFAYKRTRAGGSVSLASKDEVARAAIHDFLRFQIRDHGTGDPLESGAAR